MPTGLTVIGAANGDLSTYGALEGGANAAVKAVVDLGYSAATGDVPVAEDAPVNITPFWHVNGAKRAWVDQQNDVTAKDVVLAHKENFTSVEHLKRYHAGNGYGSGENVKHGRSSDLAEVAGKQIPEVGTTVFRPPYTPTAIGAFAGRSRDANFRPVRKTPSHQYADEQGAVFVEVGMWLRAQWFPKPGETHWRQSVDREVLQTRNSVGICDVTTLGKKIDVQGADAAIFLNKIYCNPFAKVPVGKVRYGLMLREDGIAMDDGTAARLAEDYFVVTTTTANAVGVYRHMEFRSSMPLPGAWTSNLYQQLKLGPNLA